MPTKTKTFMVYVYRHPIERETVKTEAFQILCRNQTLHTLRRQFAPGRDVHILLNGLEVEESQWKKIRIKTDSKVEFVPAVSFFAAIAAVGSWLVSGAALANIALNLILGLAFSYLGGMLFGQQHRQTDDKAESQNYSWNPQTTSREGIPRPRAYGTTMHTGNVIARWTDSVHGIKADFEAAGYTNLWRRLFGPYNRIVRYQPESGGGEATEHISERSAELLYMLVDFGEGPVEGRVADGLYLNDQPVGNYPDVTVQERNGTMDQTCMTGFEKTRIEYRPASEVTYTDGAVTFTTPNNFFDDVEFTLEFPRGLWRYDDSGERRLHSVGAKVEISVAGADTWTTLLNQNLSGDVLSPIYRAYKASDLGFTCVHGTQYDLRVTKTSEDKDQGRYGDGMVLRAVREVMSTAFTHPGHVLIGITAAASSLLNGDIQIKCLWKNRVVNTYNGVTWTIQHSRNPAWAVLDILTQPVITGNGSSIAYGVDRYEGFDSSQIDLAWFYEWAAFCDEMVPDGNVGSEARCYCDYNIDYATDVWTVANELAQVNRAHLYWQGNVLTGYIDGPVDAITDLVTWDTVMANSWHNAWTQKADMAGTIDMFFRDALQGDERKNILWSNENSGTYTRTISLEGSGIRRKSQAVRTANHALKRNQLIRNVNAFDMHKDAIRYKLGDVIRLQAKTPDWGKNYKIRSVDSGGDTLTLDRTLEASAGDLLYVRTYDESSGVEDVDVTAYTIDSVDGKIVTLTAPLSPVPTAGDIVATSDTTDSGSEDNLKLRRVIKITQRQNNYYEVVVETYDETLFDADDDVTHPTGNPNYAWPSPARRVIQPANWDNVADIVDRMMPPAPDMETPALSNVSFDLDSGGTVTWSKRDATNPIIFRYRGVSYEITADSSANEFIYWDPDYTDRFLGTNNPSVAIAAGNWPVYWQKDGVGSQAVGIRLLHASLILAGTIRAESYAQLRQTMPWMREDSCDATYPFTMNVKVPSEWEADVSYKLSFKILPFRAYSTGAASGGGATSGSGGGTTVTSASGGGQTTSSGGGQTSSSGGGQTTSSGGGVLNGETTSNSALYSGYTSYEDGTGSHRHGVQEATYNGHKHYVSIDAHTHTVSDHTHTVSNHTHTVDNHTHNVTIANHTHTTPAHTHPLVFGIYEETNAVNLTYAVNNGVGFGAESASYNSDQTDLDITNKISGPGWKAIRFTVNARCRIVGILEAKVDITA